ncbi:DsbA family oxidoreductase [Paenibacillus thiaminolyticus]|uniref:DsbA family oxidoreductase n=1 Tax=Paenibacillus thiaminolyticus TaxID=49283 RepID=UPI003D285B29
MKVEIWSDVACPFCYIGKRRFEEALSQFGHGDKVEVIYRSFQLDPNAEQHPTKDAYTAIAEKYGVSREQSIAMHEDIVRQGKEAGIDYQFDAMIMTNTMDAHRLIHFAGQYGKRDKVAELLFKAYFTDGKNVSEKDTLLAVAAEAGLEREAAASMLESEQFTSEVEEEMREANQLGCRGVPFFVFNRKYAVGGAQQPEMFLEVLDKAWKEEHPLTVLTPEGGEGLCTDDSCGIGEK